MTPSEHRLLSLPFLSAALMFNLGNISAASLASVITAVGVSVLSFSSKPLGRPLPHPVAVGLIIALGATTVFYNRFLAHPVFLGTFGLLAAAIVLYSMAKAPAARILAFALAATVLAIGIVANITRGSAGIDVFKFQQVASQALLHGRTLIPGSRWPPR